MKNKVAVFGVFTSLALILSYVELLIPINFGIPGMKLGLANLLVVILLYKGCPRDALLRSVIRILLSGLIFGNMFSIFYSLGGGLLSLAVMVFLKRPDSSLSPVSVLAVELHIMSDSCWLPCS